MKQKRNGKNRKSLFRGEVERTDAEKQVLAKRKKIIGAVSLVIALALFVWIGYILTEALMFSLDSEDGIKGAARNFKELINGYGNAGVFVALGIQILQIIISPIPGEVVEVGMGLCFGWFWGTVICLIGGAIAAAAIMLFVKKFGFKAVELFVPLEKINQLRFINSEKKLEKFVFLLYLIPGTPKDPLIFFFGLTRIRTSDFVVISTLARIPSIVTSAIAGTYLVKENYLVVGLIFAITGVISLVGWFFYGKILDKMEERKKHKEQD